MFRSGYPAGVLFVALFVVFGSKPKAWIIQSIKNGLENVNPFLSSNGEISTLIYEFIVPPSVNYKTSGVSFMD